MEPRGTARRTAPRRARELDAQGSLKRRDGPMAAEDDWWQLLTCTHDFEAELSSELSVKAEEQVRIVATGGDGWVVVSNSSGRSGLVPLAYLQRSSE